MEPFPPFAAPYANGLPPWDRSGHFDRPLDDDSGYASDDSDSAPFLSLDPDNSDDYTNHINHAPPWMQRHQPAAAIVSAQWSRPVAFSACHGFHDSSSDSSRTYGLPQALPFEEQQPNNYELGSRLKPTTTTSYNRRGEIFDRETFGHTAPHWDLFEEKTSPLDVEEHKSRVPDTLPSLSNRIIKNETEHYPPSPNPNPLVPNAPIPEIESEDSQSLGSITSTQPDNWNGNGNGNGNMLPSTTRPRSQCHNQYYSSSSHDAELTAAWRALYRERRELENDRRVLMRKRKREKSLV